MHIYILKNDKKHNNININYCNYDKYSSFIGGGVEIKG